MEREKIKAYQQAQTALLEYADAICQKNNLKYYLAYGTLIGAMRHRGFIPWDPDIDIMLYRADYDRFCEIVRTYGNDVIIDDYITNKKHITSHAILRLSGTHVIRKQNVKTKYVSEYDGIYIDIFPIDNVPDDTEDEIKQIEDIKRIERILTLKLAPIYKNTPLLKRIIKNSISFLLSGISIQSLNRMRDKVMQRYNSKDTRRVTTFCDPGKYDYLTMLFMREWLGEPIKLPFGDDYFSAPTDPDKCLKVTYGDYMKLPPETDRWEYVEKVIDSIDYGSYQPGNISLIQGCGDR